MAFEKKPGDGAIFPNKYKADGDRKPSFTGSVYVHRDMKVGERIELALWPHKAGGGYSIKASEPRSLSQEAFGDRPAAEKPLSDDIPF